MCDLLSVVHPNFVILPESLGSGRRFIGAPLQSQFRVAEPHVLSAPRVPSGDDGDNTLGTAPGSRCRSASPFFVGQGTNRARVAPRSRNEEESNPDTGPTSRNNCVFHFHREQRHIWMARMGMETQVYTFRHKSAKKCLKSKC